MLRTTNRGSSSSFSEQPPKTLVEAIYQRLRQDILNGKLPPGAKLRFSDLKSNYEGSIGTLREALSRLTADRLVIAEGQRGFKVAPISMTEFWEITKLRIEIETTALEAAIDGGNDSWEAEILASLHRLSKFQSRDEQTPILLTEEGALLHRQFHMSLLSACPSVWRLRLVDLLYDQSERYRRLQTSYRPELRNSSDEHRELAEAVISRNKERATALLTLHLEKTAETLETVEELLVAPMAS